MPTFQVPSVILPAFSYALSAVPIGVPFRWRKVAEYVRKHAAKLEAINESPLVNFGSGKQISFDLGTDDHFRQLVNIIKPGLLNSYQVPLAKEIIFVPSKKYCCDAVLKIMGDRSSLVTLYTCQGTLEAKAYHTFCQACRKRYWMSYEEKDEMRTFYGSFLSMNYIMITRSTAFSIDYLREIAYDVKHGRSFLHLSDRYNELYATSQPRSKVFKTRLEEAYYVTEVLKLYSDDVTFPMCPTSNTVRYALPKKRHLSMDSAVQKFLDSNGILLPSPQKKARSESPQSLNSSETIAPGQVSVVSVADL